MSNITDPAEEDRIENFSEFTARNPIEDPLVAMQTYRGHVATQLLKRGEYDEEVIAGLDEALYSRAKESFAPDLTPEQYAGTRDTTDDDLRVVSRFSEDPAAAQAARTYMALRDPATRVEGDTTYDGRLESARRNFEAASGETDALSKARRAALSDGTVPFTTFKNSDGSERLEISPTLLDAAPDDKALAAVFEANPNLDSSQIPEILRQLATPESFTAPLAKIHRQQDFLEGFDAMTKADPKTFYQVAGLAKAVGEGEMDNLDAQLANIDSNLSGSPLAAQFTPAERKTFLKDYITRMAEPGLDEDDMTKNVRTLSTGEVRLSTAAFMSKDIFDRTLAVVPQAQQEMVRAQREQVVEASAPRAFKTILARRPEFADDYAKAKSEGKTNTQILDEWTSDPDNKSTAYEYVSGLAESIPGAVATAAAAIPAVAGNEFSADVIRYYSKADQERKEFANLLGKDLGPAYDIGTMLAPMVVDIAISKGAATVARSTIGAAARAAVKPVVRAALENAVSAGSRSMLEEFALGSAARSIRSGAQSMGVTVGAGEARLAASALKPSQVLSAVGDDIVRAIGSTEATAGYMLSGFNRSAGSAYVQLYDTLEKQGKLSPEEIRDTSMKHAVIQGMTVALTSFGFNLMGKGGLERIYQGGMSRKQAEGVYANLKANMGKLAPSAVEGVNMASANKMLVSLMNKSAMPLWKVAGRGALEEFPEEMSQQFLQDIDTAWATGEKFDINNSLKGAVYAGLLGAVGGGLATGGADVLTRSAPDANVEAAAQRSILLETASKLNATSPKTAAALRDLARNGFPPAQENIPQGVPAAGDVPPPSDAGVDPVADEEVVAEFNTVLGDLPEVPKTREQLDAELEAINQRYRARRGPAIVLDPIPLQHPDRIYLDQLPLQHPDRILLDPIDVGDLMLYGKGLTDEGGRILFERVKLTRQAGPQPAPQDRQDPSDEVPAGEPATVGSRQTGTPGFATSDVAARMRSRVKGVGVKPSAPQEIHEAIPEGTEVDHAGEMLKVLGYEDDGRIAVAQRNGAWKHLPAGTQVKVLAPVENPHAGLVADVEDGFDFLDRLKLQDAPEAEQIPSGDLPRGTRYFSTNVKGPGQATATNYAITPEGLLYDDSGRGMTHGGSSPYRLVGKVTTNDSERKSTDEEARADAAGTVAVPTGTPAEGNLVGGETPAAVAPAPAPAPDARDTTYEKLAAKGTPAGPNMVELTDKQVSPAIRAKLRSNRDTERGLPGRPEETGSFFLRPKADVTGIPTDRGWILKDKRPDFAARNTPAAPNPQQTTQDTQVSIGDTVTFNAAGRSGLTGQIRAIEGGKLKITIGKTNYSITPDKVTAREAAAPAAESAPAAAPAEAPTELPDIEATLDAADAPPKTEAERIAANVQNLAPGLREAAMHDDPPAADAVREVAATNHPGVNVAGMSLAEIEMLGLATPVPQTAPAQQAEVDPKTGITILPPERASEADIQLGISQGTNYFTLWFRQPLKIDEKTGRRTGGYYNYLTILSKDIDEARAKAENYARQIASGEKLPVAFAGRGLQGAGSAKSVAVTEGMLDRNNIEQIEKTAIAEQEVGVGQGDSRNTLVKDLWQKDPGLANWIINKAYSGRLLDIATYLKKQPAWLEAQDERELESERIKAYETRRAARDIGKQVSVTTLVRKDGEIVEVDESEPAAPEKPKLTNRKAKDQIVNIIEATGGESLVPPNLANNMFPMQVTGANSTLNSMAQHGVALNGDGAGVGKTRQIIAVASHYAAQGKRVFIITENAAIGKPWEKKSAPKLGGSMSKDSEAMGVQLELLGEVPQKDGGIYVSTYNRVKAGDIPDGAILIFDESQNLANTFGATPDEKAGSELRQWEDKFRNMLPRAEAVAYYSATPADKPHQLAYLHKILGFETPEAYLAAAMDNGVVIKTRKFGRTEKQYYDVPSSGKRSALYKWVNGIMLKAGTDGKFIKREISYEGTDVQFQDVNGSDDVKNPSASYFNDVLATMEAVQQSGMRLLAPDSYVLYAAELSKIGTAVELAKKELAAGRKAVIYFSRIKEMEIRARRVSKGFGGETILGDIEVVGTIPSPVALLKAELEKAGIKFAELHGQSGTTSQKAQKDFEGGTNVLLASVESGGTGINLDDTSGKQPRTEIFMFAPYRGISTVQAMGRIWRASTIQNDNNPNRYVMIVASDIKPDAFRSAVLAKKLQLMGAAMGGTAVARMPMSKTSYRPEQLAGLEMPEDGGENAFEKPRTGKLKAVRVDWKKAKSGNWWSPASADLLEWEERGGPERTGLDVRVFKGDSGEWIALADEAYTPEQFGAAQEQAPSEEPTMPPDVAPPAQPAAPVKQIPATSITAELDAHGGIEDIPAFLASVARSGKPEHRALAKLLALFPAPPVVLVNVPTGPFAGAFVPATGQVLINTAQRGPRGAVDTVLHELVHAATEASIVNPTAKQKVVLKRIDAYRKTIAKRAEQAGMDHLAYGLGSNSEFFTHFLTSPQFQREVGLLTPKGEKSFVQLIIEAIRDLLNGKSVKKGDEVGLEVIRDMVEFMQDTLGRHVKGANGEILMLPAHHGTPHKVGKFSLDKIGTGEGNQSYGYGLYFAGDRRTAEYYRDVLGNPDTRSNLARNIYFKGELFFSGGRYIQSHEEMKSHGPMAYEAIKSAAAARGVDRAVSQLREADPFTGETDPEMLKIALWIEKNSGDFTESEEPTGANLYTVELLIEDDEFLDWDKPLSEQGEKVKAAVGGILIEQYQGSKFENLIEGMMNVEASTFYNQMAINKTPPKNLADGGGWGDMQFAYQGPKAASEALHAAGIKGIRYLDGNSRNRPFREIKQAFLDVLPEDAEIDDVVLTDFSPEQQVFLEALANDDWLGFEYPAQAISAALSDKVSNWDASKELLASIETLRGNATYNYVVFNDADIKITHENGQPVTPEEASHDPRDTSRMGQLLLQPAEVRDFSRFSELTESLYQGREEATAEQIAGWKATHESEWAELTKMRERVLRAAGYDVGPVFHGTSPTRGGFNVFTNGITAKDGFRLNFDGLGPGWFTSDSNQATNFGSRVIEAHIKLEKPYTVYADEFALDNHIQARAEFLALEKKDRENSGSVQSEGFSFFRDGLTFEERNRMTELRKSGATKQVVRGDSFEALERLGKEAKISYPELSEGAAIRQGLEDQGYDGIILEATNADSGWKPKSRLWVIPFKGEGQIKSADPISAGPKVTPDQWGDTASPDIRFQPAEEFNQEIEKYVTGNWPADAEGRYAELGRFAVRRMGDLGVRWRGDAATSDGDQKITRNGSLGGIETEIQWSSVVARTQIAKKGRSLTTLSDDGKVTIKLSGELASDTLLKDSDELEAKTMLAREIQEEIIHAAHMQSFVRKNPGLPNYREAFFNETVDLYRDVVLASENPAEQKMVFEAVTAAYALYGDKQDVRLGDSAMMAAAIIPNFANVDSEATRYQTVAELLRQVIQLRRSGDITENTFYKIRDRISSWFTKFVDAIKTFAANPEVAGEKFNQTIKETEAVLDELGIRFQPAEAELEDLSIRYTGPVSIMPGGISTIRLLASLMAPAGVTVDTDQLAKDTEGMDPANAEQVVRSMVNREASHQAGLGAIRFQFAGESAEKPAFMSDSLDTAKAMAAAGKPSEEIRAVTGWFPGKYDGKMRWEIPDNGATLTDRSAFNAKATEIYGGEVFNSLAMKSASDRIKSGKVLRVKDVLNHPDLYAAYPASAEIPFFPIGGNAVNGSLRTVDGGKLITATLTTENGQLSEQSRSVILHEVQHFIQDVEDFAKGGSPDGLISRSDIADAAKFKDAYIGLNRYKKQLGDLADALAAERGKKKGFLGFGGPDGKAIASLEAEVSKITATVNSVWDYQKKHLSVDRDSTRASLLAAVNRVDEKLGSSWVVSNRNEGLNMLYKSLAGEIEAHDVQARASMTPEQLAATAPYSSENIAPEAAILLFQPSADPEEAARLRDLHDRIVTGNTTASDIGYYRTHPTALERLVRYLTAAVQAIHAKVTDRRSQVYLDRLTRELVQARRGYKVTSGTMPFDAGDVRMQPSENAKPTYKGVPVEALDEASEFINDYWWVKDGNYDKRDEYFRSLGAENVDDYMSNGFESVAFNHKLDEQELFNAAQSYAVGKASGEPVEMDTPIRFQPSAESARHAELESRHNAGTITPEETAEAERLVEARARAAGYDTEAWHASSTPDITQFRPASQGGNVFARPATWFAGTGDKARSGSQKGSNEMYHAFLKIANPTEDGLDLWKDPDTGLFTNNDGFVSFNDDGSVHYAAVFSPEQIKSADAFTGTPLDQRFNAASPDIRFQLTEPTSPAALKYVGYHRAHEGSLAFKFKAGERNPAMSQGGIKNWFINFFGTGSDLIKPMDEIRKSDKDSRATTDKHYLDLRIRYDKATRDLSDEQLEQVYGLLEHSLGDTSPMLTPEAAERINTAVQEMHVAAEALAEVDTAADLRRSANAAAKKAYKEALRSEDLKVRDKALPAYTKAKAANEKAYAEASIATANRVADAHREAVEYGIAAKIEEEILEAEGRIARRDMAQEQLARTFPEVADWSLRMRDTLTELQVLLKQRYGEKHSAFAKIDRSLGIYLVRSYAIHMDPELGNKILNDPQYAQDRSLAIQFFEQQLASDMAEKLRGKTPEWDSMSEAEIEAMVAEEREDKEFRKLKRSGKYADVDDDVLMETARENVAKQAELMFEDLILGNSLQSRSGADSNELKTNVSRFLEKKNIPEVLRNALQENKNPLFNSLHTFAELSNLLHSHRLLGELTTTGIASGVLVSQAVVEANRNLYQGWEPIVAKGSKSRAYAPLAGYYANPQNVEAFQAVFHTGGREAQETATRSANAATKFIMQMAGASLGVTTLGSIGYYVRNPIGGSIALLAQGHNPFGKGLGRAINDVRKAAFTAKGMEYTQATLGDAETAARILKLTALGIIGNGAQIGYSREIIKLAVQNPTGAMEMMQEMIGKAHPKLAEAVANSRESGSDFIAMLGNLAQLSEEVPMVIEFNANVEMLTRAEWGTAEQIDQEAARRAKLVMFSKTEVSQGVRDFSKHPVSALVAPFARFKSEVWRTLVNTYKLAAEDMRSDNAVLKAEGQKRFASALAVHGVVTMLVPLLSQVLLGIGDDEDKAIRAAMPDYDKDTSFWFYKNGKEITALNLTYNNPFSFSLDPVTSIARAAVFNQWENVPGVLTRVFTNEVFGENIVTGKVLDIKRNLNESTGLPVWLETDEPHTRAWKMSKHILEAYAPRISTNMLKAYEASKRPNKENQPWLRTPLGITLGQAFPAKPMTIDLEDSAYRALRGINQSNGQLWQITSKMNSPAGFSADDVEEVFRNLHRADSKNQKDLYEVLKGFKSLMGDGAVRELMAKGKEAGISAEKMASNLRGVGVKRNLSPNSLNKMREHSPEALKRWRELDRTRAERFDLK